MNIVHFTHGRVNPFGESGLSRTIYYLNKYQRLKWINNQIWSVVDGVKRHELYERDNFVSVELFPRVFSVNSLKNSVLKYLSTNKDGIDLFHFHLPWLIDKVIVANALKKYNIPYIVTTQGTYTRNNLKYNWIGKFIAKHSYELNFLNNAAAVHCVNYEESSCLREFGVTETPIFVVPNGIEIEEVPSNLDYHYFDDDQRLHKKIKFIWVGSFRPEKNLDSLISSIRIIPKNIRDNLAFIIIGPKDKSDKSHFSYLVKLANEFNVANSVYFKGPLYGKNKYDAIASSDVYIHPSWAEGFAFAILDAMACAKPCIITRTSNITYYYKHDFFEMIEPYPEDIARGIIEMVNKRHKWRKMGLNARRLVESGLTWEKISASMIEIYQKVILIYGTKTR